MRPTIPLWLRSAIGRPAAALGLLVVVTLAIAAAAAGPMLLRAVEQAALQNAVTSAPAPATSVVATDHTGPARSLQSAVSGVQEVAAVAAQGGLFGPATVTSETDDPVSAATTAGATAGGSLPGRLVARSDGCQAFFLLAGRCPRADSEMAVPAGAAAPPLDTVLSVGREHVRYTVVGTYDPARSSVTLPSSVLPAAPGVGPDLVVTLAGLKRWPGSATVVGQSQIVPARLGVDQEPAARATVAAARQVALGQASSMSFDSGLADLLDRVAAERVAVSGLVFVVTAQVVALALVSAAAVMQTLARARSREWALSRLRGVRRRAWFAALFTEPAALLILGTVVGYMVGLLTSELTARWVVPHIGIEPWRTPVLATAAVVVAGLAMALAGASAGGARAPLASLLREGADPPRSSRAALVAEALTVALAAAAAYQVTVSGSLSGHGSGLALLAPGLLAAAVGLLAIRVAARVARWSTRRTPRGIGGLLVWRRLARVPSRLRRDVTVAIAAAVGVFAVQLVALAGRNELLRAQAEIGASTVLRVQAPAGKSLLDIVRGADPAGTQAMAAAERDAPTDAGTSRVVAVDTSRLARISPWRASWAGMTAEQLASVLHPTPPIRPVMLTGSRIAVTFTDVTVTSIAQAGDAGTLDGTATPATQMTLTVADPAGWHQVSFGPLRSSHQPVTLVTRLPCPAGCRLVRLGFGAAEAGTGYEANFTITQMTTSTQPAPAFTGLLENSAAWQLNPANPTGTIGAVGSAAGLRIAIEDIRARNPLSIAPTDVPDPLPAVAGHSVVLTPVPGLPSATAGLGLDDQQQPLAVVGTAAVVPRALDNGVLLDLANATALADPAQLVTSQEVWLAPGAHPGVERALTAAGVTITGRDTVAAAHAVLIHTGPARAVLVNLSLIVLAGLLAIAAIAAAQLISASERRQLWTAAAAAGVPRRAVRRAVLLEVAIPACAAALLGTLAGLAAILLAGNRLPLFAAGTVGPPLDTVPDWPLLAAACGVALAVMAVVAALSALLQPLGERR